MNRLFIFNVLLATCVLPNLFGKLPWQVGKCSKRLLIMPKTPAKSLEDSAFVKIDLSTAPRDTIPESVRVFTMDGKSGKTKAVPAQYLPDTGELLIRTRRIMPMYIVYFNIGLPEKKVRYGIHPKGENYIAKGDNYTATIHREHGHLSSLGLNLNKRVVETLDTGIY
jgi:hypothetical protein